MRSSIVMRSVADCARCGATLDLTSVDAERARFARRGFMLVGDDMTHHCQDGGRGLVERRLDPLVLDRPGIVDVALRG